MDDNQLQLLWEKNGMIGIAKFWPIVKKKDPNIKRHQENY